MADSSGASDTLASNAARHASNDEEMARREMEAQQNSYLNASRTEADLATSQARTDSASPHRPNLRVRTGMSLEQGVGERTPLLSKTDEVPGARSASTFSRPGRPRGLQRTASSVASLRRSGTLSRSRHTSSYFGVRLAAPLGRSATLNPAPEEQSAQSSVPYDGREWYNQFTSTDWVRDSIADAHRVKELRSRRDWRGRLKAVFDGAQGWILVAFIGLATAAVTYLIDVTESTIHSYKFGYCKTHWSYNVPRCCSGAEVCSEWQLWSDILPQHSPNRLWLEFGAFNAWVILLSVLSCIITLQTKTTISSAMSLSTLDENLGADHHTKSDTEGRRRSLSPARHLEAITRHNPIDYYPAAGSGVAEVKVILSGFVLHGYLGVRTLVCKAFGLVLSASSGLSLGKEGPYVHIAACIGNISARVVPKYRDNDGKRREVLSAAAAAGVALAFGAPLAGVLFSLEEVSYYFPSKVLFRTFFCCIVAALSLRFLDPYGTGEIVLFQVKYLGDWKLFEIFVFIILGMCGGVLGALFIKAARTWAKTFRRIPAIRTYPIVEVLLVALVTGLSSFWNRYTRLSVAELLHELAAPCDHYSKTGTNLCPTKERIPGVIWTLCMAFIIKAVLTLITFGIKVPAGIYVPSMVVGGILGRIVGHSVQLFVVTYPQLFASCPSDNGHNLDCITPGVYALVAAGATMCGVTRLSVTLAVILFELTGSLQYVLPFSLGVMFAKWTADMLEPASIYDLLTDMNSYPYLDAKVRPGFTSDLGEIITPLDSNHFIDISFSPLVPASELRSKLNRLHMAGELDGGLPILKDQILVGLIPAPDLEFALDQLHGEESALCLMTTYEHWTSHSRVVADGPGTEAGQVFSQFASHDATDLTSYIDSAPVALDTSSPMDLVFECFVKLGLRYICVLRDGKFCGMVHKKTFVRYVKQVEKEGKDT